MPVPLEQLLPQLVGEDRPGDGNGDVGAGERRLVGRARPAEAIEDQPALGSEHLRRRHVREAGLDRPRKDRRVRELTIPRQRLEL